jgi:hypothetical protein
MVFSPLIMSAAFSLQIAVIFAQDSLVLQYSQSITKEELSTHVYKLASDEFEGRFTGTRGQGKAQNYITKEFEACGLQMPVISGKATFTQEFTLDECRWKDQRLTMNGEGFQVGKDFLFLSDPVDIKGDFPVVFAGFGVDDSVYSDFGNIDVKGKIMLAFTGEPRDTDGNSYISGKKELSKKGILFQ